MTRSSVVRMGLALMLASGCGAESETADFGTGLPGGSSGGGAAGTSAPPPGSMPPGVPGGPGGGGGQAGVSGSSGDDCGRATYEAERRQLDIYVMFDESGSMIPWWVPVTDAFMSFVEDPRSAGIGVGIQFFGPRSQCDHNFYANPKVPIGLLPGNAGAIRNSFPLPFGGTPTDPALRGAVMHARSWAQSHPDHKVVVLLVTDGLPSDCASTVEGSAMWAADGFNGTPSIQTYVLGIGNGLALDRIAEAGGTGRAITVGATQDAVYQAMNQIRGEALPCDYAVPADADDLEKVNLDLNVNGNITRIPQVAGRDACHPDQGGWYYNADSSRILACDRTCAHFNSAESGSRVDVVLGCPTVVIR